MVYLPFLEILKSIKKGSLGTIVPIRKHWFIQTVSNDKKERIGMRLQSKRRARYVALQKICKQAWDVVTAHVQTVTEDKDGTVTSNVTTVTENLLRKYSFRFSTH